MIPGPGGDTAVRAADAGPAAGAGERFASGPRRLASPTRGLSQLRMADRDDPPCTPVPVRPAGEVASNVISIANRVRRRESQRTLDKARKARADHTWQAETRAELAEHAATLEALDLDDALPEGDTREAREARAVLLCARANRAHLRGDAEGAFADWARAIEAAPHAATAYILRGAVLAARGETEAAQADLDRATELAPNDASAFYRRGELFAMQGLHERALANYRRALALAPKLLSNLSAMATSFLVLEDRRGAIGALDRAIRIAPSYADFYLRRAVCHVGLGQADAALRDYDRSLELHPQQAQVLRLRAYILQDRGLHARAIADLERACALEPDQVENRRALGRARVLARPGQATLDQLTDLLVLCPKDDLLYGLRARVHHEAGDVAAAIADFETAARIDPTCATYTVALAELRGALVTPEATLELVDQLLAVKPDDAPLLVARSRLHARAGQLAEALRDVDASLAVDPVASAHQERASILQAMDDTAGAAAAMARAVALEPENGVYHAWLGYYRLSLDDPREEIAADLDRAVALSPESAVPWFYRALFLDEEDRLEEAISDLDQALSIQPEWGVLYYRRATCRRALGGFILDGSTDEEGPTAAEEAAADALTRAAVADLERCVALGVEDWHVYEELYFARSILLDDKGALAALDGAIGLDAPGGWLHYLRHHLRKKLGDDLGARCDMGTALARGYIVRDENELRCLQEYARGAETGAGAGAIGLTEQAVG